MPLHLLSQFGCDRPSDFLNCLCLCVTRTNAIASFRGVEVPKFVNQYAASQHTSSVDRFARHDMGILGTVEYILISSVNLAAIDPLGSLVDCVPGPSAFFEWLRFQPLVVF